MAKGPLGKVADVFSKVEPGEGLPVVLLLVDLFLILTSYYILKVVRETFVSATAKSYSAVGQAILLIPIVEGYSYLASRVNRRLLISIVTFIFIGSFVVFYILAQAGVPIGIPFYLWLGIFNMMVIAQFWSLSNELFTVDQGKRLFAIIAMGGTFGAIVGSYGAGALAKPLGVNQLMLVAAGVLFLALLLTNAGVAAARRGPHSEEAAGEKEDKPLEKGGGFSLVIKKRYLLIMAVMIILYNLVNTNGEFIVGKVAREVAAHDTAGNEEAAKVAVAQFYGNLYTWVNVIAAIVQAFIVSRLIRFVGVRYSLLILPLIAMGGYFTMAVLPVLMFMKIGKIAENSTDYSLHNTLRQSLWLPTTPAEKYKAKNAIDTFFVRFGDCLSALLVFIGTAIALPARGFAFLNVLFAAMWLVLAVIVGRHFAKLEKEHPDLKETAEGT